MESSGVTFLELCGSSGKGCIIFIEKAEHFFSFLASSYKSYHTLAADSGNQKHACLMDPSCSYSPTHKTVFLMRSSSWTMIIHSFTCEKDCVLLCLKPCTWFSFALCQHKSMDFIGLSYFYCSQREEPDCVVLAFASSPSLACPPYSLFVKPLFFPFQRLSNCGSQGSGCDEVLSLSKAKNARRSLSLTLQGSPCCSYMGQGVDLLLDEHWKWREV